MPATNNQFKALVQHELARLETVIRHNESVGMYPVRYRQYASNWRSGTLKQSSRYVRGLFSFARALQFMSF